MPMTKKLIRSRVELWLSPDDVDRLRLEAISFGFLKSSGEANLKLYLETKVVNGSLKFSQIKLPLT